MDVTEKFKQLFEELNKNQTDAGPKSQSGGGGLSGLSRKKETEAAGKTLLTMEELNDLFARTIAAHSQETVREPADQKKPEEKAKTAAKEKLKEKPKEKSKPKEKTKEKPKERAKEKPEQAAVLAAAKQPFRPEEPKEGKKTVPSAPYVPVRTEEPAGKERVGEPEPAGGRSWQESPGTPETVKSKTEQEPAVKSESTEPATEPVVEEEAPPTAFSKTMHVVFNVVFYAALIVIIVGSIVFATSKDPGKSYFGYRFYSVLSNSMLPNAEAQAAGLKGGFKKGDLILIQMVEPAEIKVGDIITFQPDAENASAYLTHRVVDIQTSLGDIEGLFFTTRGDANNADDPPVSGEMVVGKKVAVVPYVGTAVAFVRDHFLPVIIFVVGGFGTITLLRLVFAKPEAETA